jgi:hypothetical protein
MLELLGVLTFVNRFISGVCIPAISCSLPKYFKLKPPEYKEYGKLLHMVCLTHLLIQSDFKVLNLLILVVGKEDGKREGSLVRSGRYFMLHFLNFICRIHFSSLLDASNRQAVFILLLFEFHICGFTRFGLMLLFLTSCNVLVLGHHGCTCSFIVYFSLSRSNRTCS